MLSALRVKLDCGLSSFDLELTNVKRGAKAFICKALENVFRTSAGGKNNTSKPSFWARHGNQSGECDQKVKISRGFLGVSLFFSGTTISTLLHQRERRKKRKKKEK